MGEGGLFPNDREGPGNTVTFGNSQDKPQICTGGIQRGSSKNVTGLIAQPKSLHTNARNVENKQEEPEAAVQSENDDLIATTAMW